MEKDNDSSVDYSEKILNKYYLIKGINSIVSNLEIDQYDLIKAIFYDEYYSQIESILDNFKISNKSDIIISYGNDNYIFKIFIKKIIEESLKQKDSEYTYIELEFNGYIHKKEEIVLKELCNKLNVPKSRAGFDNYLKTLENYFNTNSRRKSKTKIIIYYDYIEYLIEKKKQTLLYSLLEILNISNDILLIGFTTKYNLIDQMEKRVRSRFSHKSIYITLPEFNKIIGGIEYMFKEQIKNLENKGNNLMIIDDINSDNDNSNIDNSECDYVKNKGDLNDINKLRDAISIFTDCIISDETDLLILLIAKLFRLGSNLKEIIKTVKYILISFINYIDANDSYNNSTLPKNFIVNNISKEDIWEAINNVVKDFNGEISTGCYLNTIKNFPKLHITLLICLCYCANDYKEKITVGMIHKKYYELIVKKNELSSAQKSKLDSTLVKKYLEEMYNSNLITIKNDFKYGNLYELKLPIKDTIDIILKLEGENKLDDDMKRVAEKLNY